jgi:diguanylate cyclase (GGDEF)-like protein
VFAGIGFFVWRRSAKRGNLIPDTVLPQDCIIDSQRCHVLLGNIGQVLMSHSRFLADLDHAATSSKQPVTNRKSGQAGNPAYSDLLSNRVDELSDVLEKYDDLYLHERLHLRDYAGRAEELELLLKDVATTGDDQAKLLVNLVHGMLRENQELRQTVDTCRSRIDELIELAARSGRDARIDPLTQLPNRRAWAEQITLLDKEASRSVAVVDLDDFKQINDKYGHAAGDAVLRLAARIFRESQHSMSFRNGGDEFYFLIDTKSLDEAVKYLDSIRLRIERAGVLFDGKRLSTTITGGVAMPEPEETISEALLRADSALYAAKESGKNKIAFASAGCVA